jgi:uroporphyrinogen decarboxylase
VTDARGAIERFNARVDSARVDAPPTGYGMGRLLDALVEYQVELVGPWAAMGADAVFITDDWGTQSALMCSPVTWREVFAARCRRICDAAHRAGLAVILHSCGNVAAVVGDLIGVDVLDPIQPEAIDLAWLAREYGGEVAFAGGIPVQSLPTLTPAQVRDTVARLIDLLGAPFGNALILAPSNSLLPDVPFPNLVALFLACHGAAA